MSHFQNEIYAQPEILEALLHDEAISKTAETLKSRPIRLILTLARGSSDNAVTFFSYLAGQYLGLPVASLPPSLFTIYSAKLKLADALVIGISQSGESSDVVEGLRALRDVGASTVAVSNNAESALARHADFSLSQGAGQEQAVAASKTFSSQMMVLAVLVAHWSGDTDLLEALSGIPAHMRHLLDDQRATQRAALRLTHADSLYALGRGLSYGPAQELALKLKETSYVHAQAYSSAEFQHGPIAAVSAKDPIIMLGNDDGTLPSNLTVADRLHELEADLTVVSGSAKLLKLANARIPLPAGLHPVSETFLQVLVGQLLALHLSESKGLEPDEPRHLKKVTKTL